jgi:hypothetical protein
MLTKEIVLEAILKCANSAYTADLTEVSKELGVKDNSMLVPVYKALENIGYVTMFLGTATITAKGLKEIRK